MDLTKILNKNKGNKLERYNKQKDNTDTIKRISKDLKDSGFFLIGKYHDI